MVLTNSAISVLSETENRAYLVEIFSGIFENLETGTKARQGFAFAGVNFLKISPVRQMCEGNGPLRMRHEAQNPAAESRHAGDVIQRAVGVRRQILPSGNLTFS